jgi:hypothetical protein
VKNLVISDFSLPTENKSEHQRITVEQSTEPTIDKCFRSCLLAVGVGVCGHVWFETELL